MAKRITRFDKVADISKIAKEHKLDITTLTFLMATMTDKGLTKFHKELKEKYDGVTEN